jgi:hypothetical protein
MWWVIGITAYLMVLSLGLMFLYGSSKLEDYARHSLDRLDQNRIIEILSDRSSPHQLTLPFSPPAGTDLHFARYRLVAALLGKFVNHL